MKQSGFYGHHCKICQQPIHGDALFVPLPERIDGSYHHECLDAFDAMRLAAERAEARNVSSYDEDELLFIAAVATFTSDQDMVFRGLSAKALFEILTPAQMVEAHRNAKLRTTP